MTNDTFVSIKQALREALVFTKGDQISTKVTTIQISGNVRAQKIREQSRLTEPEPRNAEQALPQ